MWLDILISIIGLAAALILGYFYRLYGPELTQSSAPTSKFVIASATLVKLLVGLTVFMGITGFLSMPLHQGGLWDSLVLLHTLGGGCLVIVLGLFIIPRAAGMGFFLSEQKHETEDAQDRRLVGAFWGIVFTGLLLVSSILAVLSTSISQAEQSCWINLHALAAFLFILMVLLFSMRTTSSS